MRYLKTTLYGLTAPLLQTAGGAKMGKTAKGAVWLAPERRSPFDYFQYWLNIDDRDVGRFLKLYTFMPLDEIARLEALQGADIREAKRVLARQATTLLHGAEAAANAEAGAQAMTSGVASQDMPTHRADLGGDLRVIALLAQAQLTKSMGEGRRLIKNGGVRIDNDKVTEPDHQLDPAALAGDGVVLRVGKKRAVRVLASS